MNMSHFSVRTLSRRDVLAGAAALALPSAAGCRCAGGPTPGSGDGAPAKLVAPPWHELSFEPSAIYAEEERALVLVPEGAAALPVVVALHGRGETRSLDAGARGFRDDYGLDRVDGRLRAPPITSDDLLGFTDEERLSGSRTRNSSITSRTAVSCSRARTRPI
jgi:hypothetical protein